ncbi:MAG: hypothetical protein Q8P59_07485, partial [Dehalococcoidia bacterium]|nr:hypothetical protein [Dehalococcoidia bacterium]
QESSQRLLELAEGAASREVRKAAGRGLHRLRSLGFRAEVRPVVPGPAAATVAPVKPKSRAWTGAMDGRGSRFLAISAPKPLGGIALILLLLNDKDGMKETHTGYVEENGDAATKVEEIVRGSKSLQVEVPLDYARFLVKEGRRRTQAIGRVLPTDYQVWKELIGEPEGDWERPPIYQELNAAQILLEPGLLEESGRLLDLKEFWNWHLGLDEMRPYAQELEQAKRPTLVLSEVAQEEREEKVLAKALEDLLDDEGRAVYKRRLEEMSYILLHTDREREAKWALAAAVALDQESSQGRIYLPGSHAADLIIGSDKSPFTRHPFFSRLLGESLEWALKEMSKGRKIITAG